MDVTMSQDRMTTAYDLPFEVRYAAAPLLSSGDTVRVALRRQSDDHSPALVEAVEQFVALSETGALAGTDIEPWSSGLHLGAWRGAVLDLQKCKVDEQALLVLLHLLLARQDEIMLQSIELSRQDRSASRKLRSDPSTLSWYPDCYRQLPFTLVNEEPESGTYTFVAELKRPLEPTHRENLENALKRWTLAILAGGYGLAPIPPQDSYVEPDDDCVTSFDSTVEWTIFKLRANPDCLQGLINIFAAFHHQRQELVSLTIS
jgi:hypothetical protein